MAPDKDALEAIRQAAFRAYPNEACGLLVEVGNKVQALECRNAAPNPREHFALNIDDYEAHADKGEVVGVWHSHPDASSEPSVADRMGCDDSMLPWLIVGVGKGENGVLTQFGMTVIEPSGNEVPLVGRPYIYGIYDCYTIVRDFYRREFGIELGSYAHAPAGWWNGSGNWFVENFEREGFVQLPEGSEFQYGDLLFMQMGKVANHAALYVGDDKILHHCVGRLSRHDVFGGYWHKHTTHHLRHQTKC